MRTGSRDHRSRGTPSRSMAACRADLLPYVKVDATSSKVGDETFRGYGYGAGAKYAVSSNVEVGAEYTRNNLKRSGTKLRGNDFTANVGYRF